MLRLFQARRVFACKTLMVVYLMELVELVNVSTEKILASVESYFPCLSTMFSEEIPTLVQLLMEKEPFFEFT